MERHAKLDPVGTTTEGVFLAGTIHGPKDIADSELDYGLEQFEAKAKKFAADFSGIMNFTLTKRC